MMMMMTRLVRAECHERIFGISSTNQWVTLERSCNTSAFLNINDDDDGKEEDRRFIQCLCCPAVQWWYMCIDLHITQLSQSGLCLCLWHASVNSVWQSMSLVVPLCWYWLSIPLWFWTYLMRDVFPVLWKRTHLTLQKIWMSSDLTLPGQFC